MKNSQQTKSDMPQKEQETAPAWTAPSSQPFMRVSPAVVGWLLAAAFFILLLPRTGRVPPWRGDERFYTDAAMQMQQSGDWLTPRYNDGTLRFRKPGMTYWAVLGSYKLFGVGVMSSRLPSLLAGALTVGLTFWMGMKVFGQLRPALGGAVLLAATSLMFKMSLRATPDALLTLFMTVSCYGFVRVLHAGRRDHVSLLLGYGGAALAIATKGLLGLLPPLFAWIWCVSARRDGVRPKELISWPALLVAVPLAGFWYVLVFLQHGAGALTEFFGDQVAERVPASPFRVLWLPAGYLLDLLYNLMPWSLFAAVLLWKRLGCAREFLAAHRRMALLTTIWLAGFLLIFSAGNMYRVRYFLPVFPLLCVVLGGFLAGRTSAAGGAVARLRPWLGTFHAGLMAVAAVLLVVGGLMGEPLALAYGALSIAASLGVLLHRGSWRMPLTAAAILVVFAQVDLLVTSTLKPSPAREVAARLVALGVEGGEVAFPANMADEISQVRLLLGGKLQPVMVPPRVESGEWRACRVIVVPEAWRSALAQAGYRLTEAGYSLGPVRRGAWLKALVTVGPHAAYEQRKQRYYVAVME